MVSALLITMSQRIFSAVSIVLVGTCCSLAFGKDIRVSAFPAAVFSPDGAAVYCLQLDLHADVRHRRTNSEGAVSAMVHVIDEVVSIRKFDLASGRSLIVTTLPRPPWVGLDLEGFIGAWFNHRQAKMWWSPDGELQYEVHGPPAILVNKKVVWYSKTPTFASSDPRWASLSYDMYQRSLRTELKYVVFGSKEVVTSYRDGQESSSHLVVLDHDLKTARLLATGSDEDRKRPGNLYTYDQLLSLSRLKGTLKEKL
jgi:hypothetical protein